MPLTCGGDQLVDLDPAAIPERPTYAKDVGPILNFHCRGCHAPDTQLGKNVGGYDYSSYQGVLDGFSGIESTVLQQGRMPPGGARKLTSWEQGTLLQWQKTGFPP